MPIVYPHKTEMWSRDAEERRHSWDEVAEGYTVERAIAEARRCLNCQDPVCEQGCPVNVPIRDFVRHVALGDFGGRRYLDPPPQPAARDLRPGLPGRAPVRVRCVLSPHQEPVGIGRLERFVADWERKHGTAARPPRPRYGATRRSRSSARARPAYRGQRPRAARLPGDDLRSAARVRRRAALRDPQYRLPKEIVDEDIEHSRRSAWSSCAT